MDKLSEKNMKSFFTTLKSLKKGVRSGVGSGFGSISQGYGSKDPDPHPHQNVTDPQHCVEICLSSEEICPFCCEAVYKEECTLIHVHTNFVYFSAYYVRVCCNLAICPSSPTL